MKTIKIRLGGLTCEACVKLSRKRIADIAGVKDVQFNAVDGRVDIMADREISVTEIQNSLAGTDYKVII